LAMEGKLGNGIFVPRTIMPKRQVYLT
jgi:hypothetical protein